VVILRDRVGGTACACVCVCELCLVIKKRGITHFFLFMYGGSYLENKEIKLPRGGAE
jgi:hypothetical protein